MRYSVTLGLVLTLIVVSSSFLFHNPKEPITNNQELPVYVGVSFCGNTTAQAKALIDKTKTYTNLFVLQSGPISKNETAINEICNYAIKANQKIIVYFGWFDTECPWQIPWVEQAKQRWKNQLLGIYYYDEPGGIQIDYNWASFFEQIKEYNYTLYQELTSASIDDNLDIEKFYDVSAELYIDFIANDPGIKELKKQNITIFTSDYALYWWDYLGGFDVILTQLGWNNSIVQEIALVRGAARMQNRSWGTIITWKFDEPPYLDSSKKIYEQMMTSYEAGAEYIIIFNYPQIEDNPYGTMTEGHFIILEEFWIEINRLSDLEEKSEIIKPDVVLVLPRNYGWGMRHPDDRIWFWGPDEKTLQIWEFSRELILQHGLNMDIIYQDSQYSDLDQYGTIYYWDNIN